MKSFFDARTPSWYARLIIALVLLAGAAPLSSFAQSDAPAVQTEAAPSPVAAQDTQPPATEQPPAPEQPSASAGASAVTEPSAAPTQAVIAPLPSTITQEELNDTKARLTLIRDQFEANAKLLTSSEGLDDNNLLTVRGGLIARKAELEAMRAKLNSKADPLRLKIKDLTPANTQEGNADLLAANPQLEELRTRLRAQLEPIEALLVQADALAVQADRLLTDLAQKRRDLFVSSLFSIRPAVFSAGFWTSAPSLIAQIWNQSQSMLSFRFRAITQALSKTGPRNAVFAFILISMGLLILPLGVGLRRVERSGLLSAEKFRLLSALLWSFWPAVWAGTWGLLFVRLFKLELNMVTSFANLLTTFSLCLGALWLAWHIPNLWKVIMELRGGHAASPAWKFVTPITLPPLTRTVIMIAALASAIMFLSQSLLQMLNLPVEAQWLNTILLSPVVLVTLTVLLQKQYFFALSCFSQVVNVQPYGLRLLLRLVVVILPVMLLVGYLAFVGFLTPRLSIVLFVVLLAAILREAFLGFWISDTVLQERRAAIIQEVQAANQNQTSNTTGSQTPPRSESYEPFWLSTGVNLVLVLGGIYLLLRLFGLSNAELGFTFQRLAEPISFGSLVLSPINLLAGALAFWLFLQVMRWIKHTLTTRLLPRTSMLPDVQHSLATLTGYVGAVIAALVGLSVAGLDLSRLALIAGALSVGIGFGLQAIGSNFVSGLILLFERPIKIGDWVILPSGEGIVKRISIRATELEAFDGRTIMVPNSELITQPVINWTHKNHRGRVTIPVGVEYQADPKKVESLLLSVAREHPLILSYPMPQAYFAGFGDSALNFELRVHLSDIMNVLKVSHELRMSIFAALKREGISIPFPQQELHIHSDRDREAFKQLIAGKGKDA